MLSKLQNNRIHLMYISHFILIPLLLASSCSASIEQKPAFQSASKSDRQNKLLLLADSVVSVIASKDWNSLSGFVRPECGLRFSPYAYVDTSNDIVFTRDQIAAIESDTLLYSWGSYDGSGNPILLTFNDYYNRFIFDKNYRDGQRGAVNQILHKGNTIINIFDAYSDRTVSFIEYHVPGSNEKYAGMDWGSLRLVFEDYKDRWYLIGIVHDQWTI